MARALCCLSMLSLLVAGCGAPAPGACAAAFAGCTTFTDMTGMGAVTITFGGNNGNAYAPKCIKVSRNTQVTFSGDFTVHPLQQSCGPASPIHSTSTGMTATFTLATAGQYGYFCTVHGLASGTGMAGAIQVQ